MNFAMHGTSFLINMKKELMLKLYIFITRSWSSKNKRCEVE